MYGGADSLHLDPKLTRKMVLHNLCFQFRGKVGSWLSPWTCILRVVG